MQTVSNELDEISPATAQRAEKLFCQHQDKIHKRTDRMFAGLMMFQWLAGIVMAIWVSPKTWIGARSEIHWHVWAALFIGGAITFFPAVLAWRRPGCSSTRHAVAVGQMLTSALLIHLSGGRVETHFHVFGSLAFLAFYRDWKVMVTATIVVALDHFLRGTFWPQSVFGVLTSSPWRWIEHAGWVVFEDIFLLLSIHQSLGETKLVAERQAKLETINQNIEKLVQERTEELKQSHKQLVEVSRQAGMAEVATSVLHNVGNVLNSINVSTGIVSDLVSKSKSNVVGKVADMMCEREADLGTFMTADVKGKQIPGFLKQLAGQLALEQTTLQKEMSSLSKNVDHVKDIVAVQQSYAKVSGATDTVQVVDLVEDALRMNASALARHDVKFFREYDEHLPEITIEKHKVVQILVNLIRNAKQACNESDSKDKRLTMRVTNGSDVVQISLADNGVGISPENLTRIFSHGFTTKKEGHGFGLHGGALAATELGGSLNVHSDGLGKGATFTLRLPCQPKNRII